MKFSVKAISVTVPSVAASSIAVLKAVNAASGVGVSSSALAVKASPNESERVSIAIKMVSKYFFIVILSSLYLTVFTVCFDAGIIPL